MKKMELNIGVREDKLYNCFYALQTIICSVLFCDCHLWIVHYFEKSVMPVLPLLLGDAEPGPRPYHRRPGAHRPRVHGLLRRLLQVQVFPLAR